MRRGGMHESRGGGAATAGARAGQLPQKTGCAASATGSRGKGAAMSRPLDVSDSRARAAELLGCAASHQLSASALALRPGQTHAYHGPPPTRQLSAGGTAQPRRSQRSPSPPPPPQRGRSRAPGGDGPPGDSGDDYGDDEDDGDDDEEWDDDQWAEWYQQLADEHRRNGRGRPPPPPPGGGGPGGGDGGDGRGNGDDRGKSRRPRDRSPTPSGSDADRDRDRDRDRYYRKIADIKLLPYPKIGELPAWKAALKTACVEAATDMDEGAVVGWVAATEAQYTSFDELSNSLAYADATSSLVKRDFELLDRKLAGALKRIPATCDAAKQLWRDISQKDQDVHARTKRILKGRQMLHMVLQSYRTNPNMGAFSTSMTCDG